MNNIRGDDIVYTLEEFLEVENASNEILEFINGYIYAKSFSSMNHNTIVNRINAKIILEHLVNQY